MERRTFLRSALGAGATAWAATHLPAALADSGSAHSASILDRPAAACPIDTIVVVMMENRSYDHHLGWLAADESFVEAGRSRYGSSFHVDGRQHLSYRAPDGSEVATYHLTDASEQANPWRGCGFNDPGHGWHNGRAERDGGFLAEGSGNDRFALGYYEAADHPCYAQLARHFTTFDRYFASVLTGTYPNRYYLHAAQSNGDKTNELPFGNGEFGLTMATIWDHLVARGVSCRYFATDLPVTGLWGAQLLGVTSSVAEYLARAATGTLPHVSVVDPGFLSGMRSDDHPHGDTRTAQAFVAAVVGALMRGPQWHRSAVIVTYDEWGGFFDHVAPPVFPDVRASAADEDNWGQAGFRLPVFLASPFARPGFVDHRVYDHTSILRFIEWRFLGAPPEGPAGTGWWLTTRDRHANNLGASLAPTHQTSFELERGSVPVTVSLPCQGGILDGIPGVGDLEGALDPAFAASGLDLDQLAKPLNHALTVPGVGLPLAGLAIPDHELAQAAGPIEDAGYRIDPSISLRELLAQG